MNANAATDTAEDSPSVTLASTTAATPSPHTGATARHPLVRMQQACCMQANALDGTVLAMMILQCLQCIDELHVLAAATCAGSS